MVCPCGRLAIVGGAIGPAPGAPAGVCNCDVPMCFIVDTRASFDATQLYDGGEVSRLVHEAAGGAWAIAAPRKTVEADLLLELCDTVLAGAVPY